MQIASDATFSFSDSSIGLLGISVIQQCEKSPFAANVPTESKASYQWQQERRALSFVNNLSSCDDSRCLAYNTIDEETHNENICYLLISYAVRCEKACLWISLRLATTGPACRWCSTEWVSKPTSVLHSGNAHLTGILPFVLYFVLIVNLFLCSHHTEKEHCQIQHARCIQKVPRLAVGREWMPRAESLHPIS